MSGDDLTTGTGAAAPRRTPRQGIGGSPVGSVLSIVLAVVAVVLGYLILRDLTDDSAAGSGGLDDLVTQVSEAPDNSFDVDVPVSDATTTTTTIPFFTDGATVVVANGNSQGGSAGRMTEALAAANFIVGDPTNASSTADASVVYYDPSVTAAKDVADSVALALGGIEVLTVTTPAPTVDGTMGEASVLLVLGNDQVDRPLDVPGTSATLGTPELDETPVVPDTTG